MTSRHLVVRDGDRVIADTHRPVALYESGFAPRWYVPRQDVDEAALQPVEGQTFCPYKGLASYYTVGDRKRAAWSYTEAWLEVERVSNLVSFEPDKLDVYLDGKQLHLEPGQSVVAHGVDRGLDPDEIGHKSLAWEPFSYGRRPGPRRPGPRRPGPRRPAPRRPALRRLCRFHGLSRSRRQRMGVTGTWTPLSSKRTSCAGGS